MSISILGAMLGPFPRAIISAIPFKNPIAIHGVMSRCIPRTMPGAIPSAIPSVIPSYFRSANFGINPSAISNSMSYVFLVRFLVLNLAQFL